MKKLLTLTLSILLAFSCLALTACMPSKPEKAKANLEDAGYTVVVTESEAVLNLTATTLGLKNGSLTAIVAGTNGGAAISIYYCVDNATASDLEEQLDDKYDDDGVEVDRLGKIVWVGTETAIKDAQ